MEDNAMLNLRAVIIACALCLTLLYRPELSLVSFRSFFVFLFRLRQRLQDLKSMTKTGKREQFWEIDMTKLEP
jgi:hypothetical protein